MRTNRYVGTWGSLGDILSDTLGKFLYHTPDCAADTTTMAPKQYVEAYKRGLEDPEKTRLPEQQHGESTQGFLRRPLNNSFMDKEGPASVCMHTATVFHSTLPPTRDLRGWHDHFCNTLAEVILICKPHLARRILVVHKKVRYVRAPRAGLW